MSDDRVIAAGPADSLARGHIIRTLPAAFPDATVDDIVVFRLEMGGWCHITGLHQAEIRSLIDERDEARLQLLTRTEINARQGDEIEKHTALIHQLNDTLQKARDLLIRADQRTMEVVGQRDSLMAELERWRLPPGQIPLAGVRIPHGYRATLVLEPAVDREEF